MDGKVLLGRDETMLVLAWLSEFSYESFYIGVAARFKGDRISRLCSLMPARTAPQLYR